MVRTDSTLELGVSPLVNGASWLLISPFVCCSVSCSACGDICEILQRLYSNVASVMCSVSSEEEWSHSQNDEE